MRTAQNDLKSGRSLVSLGTQLMFGGVLVLMIQCLLWIGDGHWTPLTIGALLKWSGSWTPTMDEAGPTQFLLAIPLAAWPAAIGFLFAWIGATNADKAAKLLDTEG